MSDAPEREEMRHLERRLRALEEKRAARAAARRRKGASPYGFGLRLVSEMVVAVAAGFLAGWGLDSWLGTAPWLVLILTPMGMAAGILNVMRAARSAEARRHLEATAPEAAGENGRPE